MRSNHASVSSPRLSVLAAATVGALVFAPPIFAVPAPVVSIRAAGFQLGTEISAGDGTNRFQLALDRSNPAALPFNQSAVKQSSEPARIGPDPKKPYFTVRFALPVPPENLTNNFAALTGMDPQVFTHNHSPGFEILPNGDCLAIYFSTPPGKSEADPTTSFIQARLRYGAEEWDLPELFFKTENFNDQSGLFGTTTEPSAFSAADAGCRIPRRSKWRLPPTTVRRGFCRCRNWIRPRRITPRSRSPARFVVARASCL
jgi:hypothetical protein